MLNGQWGRRMGFSLLFRFCNLSFLPFLVFSLDFPDLRSFLSFRIMEYLVETDLNRNVSTAAREEYDNELQEKIWEMEDETPDGNELTENNAHQMFEKFPSRVHQFYFVKWWPCENPNADTMIKRNEEIIEQMNQTHLDITKQMNERTADRHKLRQQRERHRLRYNQEGLGTEVRWWDEDDLDSQRKALDRLSFANNAYSAKGFKSCLLNGEVDKQKFHFQMLHGCRSMSEEKKKLREISASQKKDKDVGITVEDLNAPILEARRQLHLYDCYQWRQIDNNPVDREAALKELKRALHAKEKAIANAVVNGKLWNSLGSRKDIQNQLKLCINLNCSLECKHIAKQLDVSIYCEVQGMDSGRLETYKKHRVFDGKSKSLEKSLEKIGESIASLQKQQRQTCSRKDEAYESILSLKKSFAEENGRFHEYRLLLEKATTLAKKKDIAALQELSHKEMEDFMPMWNSDKGFREDYERISVRSRIARGLGKDGRRMKDKDEMQVTD